MEIVAWDGTDNELHQAALAFCRDNLAGSFDPRLLQKLWVAHRDGKILGVTGIQSRWDIPVFRAIDKRAGFEMANRLNGFFADSGLRGHDVFLFLSGSEKPEQRCPNRQEILDRWGARPAERNLISVR
jgi:hypothetical protein